MFDVRQNDTVEEVESAMSDDHRRADCNADSREATEPSDSEPPEMNAVTDGVVDGAKEMDDDDDENDGENHHYS